MGAGLAAMAGGAVAQPVGVLDDVSLVPDEERMVEVPGGRVYVRVNGRLAGGRLPIVLLHGGPGSSHAGLINATALAADRAVILYDQLDCGRSDAPGDPANWTIPRFLAELEAVRLALGVARWHVYGASWGGTLALEYGARQPAALGGLVLQSPLVSTAVWLRDAAALKAGMPAETQRLLDACDVPGAAPKDACDAATQAFYARHVRLRAVPEALAGYARSVRKPGDSRIYEAMWGRAEFTASGTLKAYDGRPLLARLDGPRTLFLAGTQDEAIPATINGFAGAVRGGAAFREVPDAAHALWNDNPRALMAVLRPWLAAQDRV
ncbi:amino acid amidase [Polymorphobacter multimanifer]|nr:amino acid amidase [Polymorphobacter multimanifer]